MKNLKYICIFFLLLTIIGCRYLAVTFTSKKKFTLEQPQNSISANKFFWDHFHRGNYDSIPAILSKLNAAYIENPNDLKVITHLGFTHTWELSESQRKHVPSPDIIENSILARRFFQESYCLNPNDPRVLAFLAGIKMGEGNLSKNDKLTVEGYFDGIKSIRMWKEFNKFSVGFVLSRLDTNTKQFDQALKWQWETLDDCACKKYSPSNINYEEIKNRIMNSNEQKIKRACWNSWIAPHNWEGFFMNFGDMFVKKGDTKEAIELYNVAKLSPTYTEWVYKNELEERIKDAEKNVKNFNLPINRKEDYSSQNVILINSKISCMSCHEMSKAEFEFYGYKEPSKDYYFIK